MITERRLILVVVLSLLATPAVVLGWGTLTGGLNMSAKENDNLTWLIKEYGVDPAALGAQQYRVADSIIESGIRRGIYPGAVLVVGGRAGIRYQRGYGHLTWSAASPVRSVPAASEPARSRPDHRSRPRCSTLRWRW